MEFSDHLKSLAQGIMDENPEQIRTAFDAGMKEKIAGLMADKRNEIATEYFDSVVHQR